MQQSNYLPVNDYSGGATPMPTESYSTPAWDPNSRSPLNTSICPSPLPIDNDSLRITPSAPGPSVPENRHTLLNPSLAGITLNVVADSDPSKPFDVNIVENNGRITIWKVRHGNSTFVEPDSVQPKYPSATHSNGLLIVIKGEHCGKYVRRIGHKHDRTTTMILAVVKKMDKSSDLLTGEQLELETDFLCTVPESTEEKKLNKDLMKELRTNFRTIR
jgi:hypothetical protein